MTTPASRRVLLVYPKFPHTYWGFQYALPMFGRKAMHSPLSLVTVAAMCPKEWELKLVDLNIEPLTDEHLDWCDMVFATAMAIQAPSLREALVRARAKGKFTVVGGPMASGAPDRVEVPVDVMVLDEAELTFAPFLADLERGETKPVYRSEKKPDITSSPMPRYDLLNLNAYSVIDVQYSRGCPFNCEFCDIIELYGRVPRTKTPQQIVAEFEELERLGYRGAIFLVDDNFIGNKKNVRMLLKELIPWQQAHGFPFYIATEASVNLAEDKPLLADMRAAGFKRVFMGIETPSKEALKETQKYQNTRGDLVDLVHTVIDAGFEVSGGFIVGFDSDQPDIFDRQVEFIEKANIPWAMAGVLSAIPGTQLWRRLEKEGRLMGYVQGDHFGRPNFRTIMDRDTLYHGYLSMLERLYTPKSYYDRLLALMDRHHAANHPNLHANTHPKVKLLGLAAVVAVSLGILAPYRMAFWRALAHVMRRYPHRLGQFLVSAVIGHHFIKYTLEVLARREAPAPAHSVRLSTPISTT